MKISDRSTKGSKSFSSKSKTNPSSDVTTTPDTAVRNPNEEAIIPQPLPILDDNLDDANENTNNPISNTANAENQEVEVDLKSELENPNIENEEGINDKTEGKKGNDEEQKAEEKNEVEEIKMRSHKHKDNSNERDEELEQQAENKGHWEDKEGFPIPFGLATAILLTMFPFGGGLAFLLVPLQAAAIIALPVFWKPTTHKVYIIDEESNPDDVALFGKEKGDALLKTSDKNGDTMLKSSDRGGDTLLSTKDGRGDTLLATEENTGDSLLTGKKISIEEQEYKEQLLKNLEEAQNSKDCPENLKEQLSLLKKEIDDNDFERLSVNHEMMEQIKSVGVMTLEQQNSLCDSLESMTKSRNNVLTNIGIETNINSPTTLPQSNNAQPRFLS